MASKELMTRRTLGEGEVVLPLAGPPPDPQQVTQRASGAGRAHRRALHRVERDRHLAQGQAVTLDEVEDLDIDGEAVEPGASEQRASHVAAERLAAALGVAVLAQQDG